MTERATAGPLVTVVIPTRNRRQLALRAVSSVLGQTVEDLEVIVVDEGSTDGTREAVEALGDRRVRTVGHEQPRGVALARNAAIALARGRWTTFLDDDDLWAPTKLSRQLAALAETPGARWACVSAVKVDDRQRITGWHRLRDASGLRERILSVNDIPGSASSVLVDTQLLREVGGFREDLAYSEDWECWIRLASHGDPAVVDAPLVAIRAARGTRSHTVGREEAANALIRSLHGGAHAAPPRTEARYLARQELRAGHRLAAAARLLTAGDPRLVPLAAVALFVPPGWEVAWTRMRESRVAPGWRREVDAWLRQQAEVPVEHRTRVSPPPRLLREA